MGHVTFVIGKAMEQNNISSYAALGMAMWRFLQRFNPWLHVAAAVGWCIAILSLVSAIGAGLLVMEQARHALERERGVLFATESGRIVDTIDAYLAARFHLMRAAAELAGRRDGCSLPISAGTGSTMPRSARPSKWRRASRSKSQLQRVTAPCWPATGRQARPASRTTLQVSRNFCGNRARLESRATWCATT